MLGSLAKLFRKPAPQPIEPFVDKALGEFTFDRDVGWRKQIILGGRQAELLLGSDGEPPSEAMLRTARSWLESWNSQLPRIIGYIRSQLRGWSEEPNLPQPEKFEVESVNILWNDKPDVCMIYFHYPGDDIRLWHVTFYGFEPHGFAYDD
jgi:hypothetical protein